MNLPRKQDELIERVLEANPNTIVVLNTGSPVTMPWAERVSAILQQWYNSQECGNALADILFGDVNPSGRLPTTFPRRYEDNPTIDSYPGKDGKTFYREGLLVGYRHYDARGSSPYSHSATGCRIQALNTATCRSARRRSRAMGKWRSRSR